jgi:hypothetical protein|tara:strand:+ start:494 stop:676 length:183 start_codon:yes stop_codon:yes gene_type:complete
MIKNIEKFFFRGVTAIWFTFLAILVSPFFISFILFSEFSLKDFILGIVLATTLWCVFLLL